MFNISNQRSGFTLLEMLMVVLIISILAAFVGVKVLNKDDVAKAAAAKAQLASLRSALQLYKMQNGNFPTQEQGLDALCKRPEKPPLPSSYPQGGYLDSSIMPKDPWKHDYVYMVPGLNGDPFDVMTYGSDGEPGGEGAAADISSSNLQ